MSQTIILTILFQDDFLDISRLFHCIKRKKLRRRPG